MRIATTQPEITADPRRNGAVVRDVLRAEAASGARLVLFPEGMLSGYAKEQHRDWSGLDWTAVADELDHVTATAKELGVWVVLGSAHPAGEARPRNSLFVISDRGEQVARYDKRICSATETDRFFTAGREPVVFEVDGLRFGCAICIEINFPDLFAEYERLGVYVVLLAAYPVDKIFGVKAQALAATWCQWVAVSAPAQTRHLVRSRTYGPDGGPTEQVDPSAPELRIALELARPWRRGIRAAR